MYNVKVNLKESFHICKMDIQINKLTDVDKRSKFISLSNTISDKTSV